MPTIRWRDYGGTFHDLVDLNPKERSAPLHQDLTTHDNTIDGISLRGLRAVSRWADASVSNTHYPSHNARLLERSGPEASRASPRRFRDVSSWDAGGRPEPFNRTFRRSRRSLHDP